MKKNILMICLVFSCFSHVFSQKKGDLHCLWKKENLDHNIMSSFLETATHRKDLIQKFKEDTSEWAILYIKGKGDTLISSSIFPNEESKRVQYDSLAKLIKKCAKYKSAFTLKYHDKTRVISSRTSFQALWIKQKGKIVFLYYTTSGDIFCLTKKDQNKIRYFIEFKNYLDDLNNL